MWILGLKWLITVQFSFLRRGSRWVSQQKQQSCNTNSPLMRREGCSLSWLVACDTSNFICSVHSCVTNVLWGHLLIRLGRRRRYSWEFLVGVCRPVLKVLTLFQTQKMSFSTPLKSIFVFRPGGSDKTQHACLQRQKLYHHY